MKFAIWPEGVNNVSKKGTKKKIISLKHPVSDSKCLCIFNSEDAKIYEITKFSEPHRSWIIGEQVCSDGSLLLVTPLDPQFLLLPYLEKYEKTFSVLQDILQDSDYPDNKYLLDSLENCDLTDFTDVKDFSGKKVYRFSETKTLKWLKAKVAKISDVLELNSLEVSTGGSSASNYVETKHIAKEAYLEYSCNLLAEYINENLLSKLKTNYGFTSVELNTPNKKRLTETENNSSPKKKLKSAIEPDEDYSSATNGNNAPKSNQKLSVTQKRLLKVDKSGMKNISSFFAKK